ncbi:MAG TPA: class I SAM-dependent methyltransferase [Marinagarivorans sp.]
MSIKVTDTPVQTQAIRASDQQLLARYSGRFESFGYDPKTLGWDTQDHQQIRFASVCRALPSGQPFTLCDIGCGFGDFRYALDRCGLDVVYSGIDINPDLVGEAKKRHPRCGFQVRNILLDDDDTPLADWVCAMGVLNFRFSDFDNESFARQFIRRAFSLAKQGLVVDMLSDQMCRDYPKEDFVYYYSPIKMLEFALQLTPHVQLVHDYAAIPQREFQLVLKHDAELPQWR